jgi:hypothetical protein
MLKNIPKSNVSNRSLKLYKKFYASQTDYPVLKIYDKNLFYHTGSGAFDSGSFERTDCGSLHDSFLSIQCINLLKHKYFTDNGLINMFGTYRYV